MDTVTVVAGVIGLVAVWWLGSSLSWVSKQDEIEAQEHAQIVKNFRENKRRWRARNYRKGFGKNPFKDKAKLRRVESDIDKVIREVESNFKD